MDKPYEVLEGGYTRRRLRTLEIRIEMMADNSGLVWKPCPMADEDTAEDYAEPQCQEGWVDIGKSEMQECSTCHGAGKLLAEKPRVRHLEQLTEVVMESPSWSDDCATPSSANDPVHQHNDGTWHFYDESWARCYGPFESREAAVSACRDYADSL